MKKQRPSFGITAMMSLLSFLLITTDCILTVESLADATKPIISNSSPSVSMSSSSSTSSLLSQGERFERIFKDILIEHQNEVDLGCSVYKPPPLSTLTSETSSSSSSSSSSTIKKLLLNDDDFIERRVGKGNAGPDETTLKNGDAIFQTITPVLTEEECTALILEARKTIDQGLSSSSSSSSYNNDDKDGADGTPTANKVAAPTNSQLGEARVSEMPLAKEWLRRALHKRLFPLLESRFGIPASDLTLQDALVIGYGYFGNGSRSQPIHRDSSLISLNVALSPRSDYEEGGTFFEALPPENAIIHNDIGNVVCHAGGTLHAGRGIASGERWVLVLFCIAKGHPELARRCRRMGIAKYDEGNLEEAKSIFQAGLSIAENDHLLWTSLGNVYMTEGNEEVAMECLSRAANAYSNCQKANLGLGKMFMAQRRPFAALQHFDAILDWMKDRDVTTASSSSLSSSSYYIWPSLRAIGFDARVIGSQAALICSYQAKEQGFDFPWREFTEKAIARLNVSLQAVPGDPRISDMIAKAEDLLRDD